MFKMPTLRLYATLSVIDPTDSFTLSLPLDVPTPRRMEFASADRRYIAALLPDLFGEWSVMQCWGGASTRGGGKIDRVASFHDGLALLHAIASTRTRRGYRLVAHSHH